MLIFYLQLVVTSINALTSVQAYSTASDTASTSTSRSNWTFRCPCICNYDDFSRKQIYCTNVTFKSIPVTEMDPSAQVLVISGSPQKPIELTLGRLFQSFSYMEEVSITYASIPAIGDSSFWPGKRLHVLNLSHNKITFLRESDFNGLPSLSQLDLSFNEISQVASASFRHLINLTRLSLANNKLSQLVPRMFYKLDKLEYLDLSNNPLGELTADDLKDTRALKSLIASGCNLHLVHSLVYQRLPHLEELDLRDNRLTHLASQEFRFLSSLRVLLLDGNRLQVIRDNTFNGHRLEALGLSRNDIKSFEECSFCNSSVKRLDISRNRITTLDGQVFKPLEESLVTLNAEENGELTNPTRSVFSMLRPLSKLRILSLASMNLDDSLPEGSFVSQAKYLKSLDMSGNKIVNMSVKWLMNLDLLEEFDFSRNQVIRLTGPFLKRLDQIKTLKAIYLHDNPWSCFRCHVLPLLDWISSKPPAYTSVCSKSEDFCIRCASPSDLAGVNLHSINEIQLEWCSDPSVQLRVSASEPRVGLVLAILIIITIIAIIVTIIVMYRKKQSATYYTHEDERGDRMSIFTIERLMSQDHFGQMVPRKSLGNHSLSPSSPPAVPFSPPQETVSPASLSPPMSPSSPLNRAHRTSPSRSLSQSLSSIPPPPPLPPPDRPSDGEASSRRPSALSSSCQTKPKQRL